MKQQIQLITSDHKQFTSLAHVFSYTTGINHTIFNWLCYFYAPVKDWPMKTKAKQITLLGNANNKQIAALNWLVAKDTIFDWNAGGITAII